MLRISLPEIKNFYNVTTDKFEDYPFGELFLEHSLQSISKWESKYKRSFFVGEKSPIESLYYIRCMTIGEPPPHAYERLTQENITRINQYVQDLHTATKIKKDDAAARRSTRYLTNELIYYWMTELGIPFTCDTWNFNHLYALIRVCGEESKPKKKMPTSEIHRRNSALNAARRQKHGSKG